MSSRRVGTRRERLGEAWSGGLALHSQPVLRSLSAFVAIASAVALADRYWLRARGYLRAGLPFKEDGEAEGAENGRAVIARTVRARALSIP